MSIETEISKAVNDAIMPLCKEVRELRAFIESLPPPTVVEPDKEQLLRIKEASQILRVSPSTTRRLLDNGEIPWVRQGAERRIRYSRLMKYIDSKEEKTGGFYDEC